MYSKDSIIQTFSGAFGPLLDSTTNPNPILKFPSILSPMPLNPELYHPPGEQEAFGENRFFIGDVSMVLGSRA